MKPLKTRSAASDNVKKFENKMIKCKTIFNIFGAKKKKDKEVVNSFS